MAVLEVPVDLAGKWNREKQKMKAASASSSCMYNQCSTMAINNIKAYIHMQNCFVLDLVHPLFYLDGSSNS